MTNFIKTLAFLPDYSYNDYITLVIATILALPERQLGQGAFLHCDGVAVLIQDIRAVIALLDVVVLGAGVLITAECLFLLDTLLVAPDDCVHVVSPHLLRFIIFEMLTGVPHLAGFHARVTAVTVIEQRSVLLIVLAEMLAGSAHVSVRLDVQKAKLPRFFRSHQH